MFNLRFPNSKYRGKHQFVQVVFSEGEELQAPTVASSLRRLATPICTVSKELGFSNMELPSDMRASPQEATTRVELTTSRRCKSNVAIGDRFKVKLLKFATGAMLMIIPLRSPTFNTRFEFGFQELSQRNIKTKFYTDPPTALNYSRISSDQATSLLVAPKLSEP